MSKTFKTVSKKTTKSKEIGYYLDRKFLVGKFF
jgi:hypothetical protein